MGCRTRRAVAEVAALGRPRDVAVVVGAVEVNAVPAGREVNVGEDALRAHVPGEGEGSVGVARVVPD